MQKTPMMHKSQSLILLFYSASCVNGGKPGGLEPESQDKQPVIPNSGARGLQQSSLSGT